MIRGAVLSPDGRWFYYVVTGPEIDGDSLRLRRVSLDTFACETVLAIRDEIPGTRYRPSQVSMLSTISSDGRRLATGCFLGDGQTEGAPFGLLVFDLDEPAVRVVPLGPDFNNLHPQYCRAPDPRFAHDVLIQHNHGAVVDALGKAVRLVGAGGADLHVVRDDGSDWRDPATRRFRSDLWLGTLSDSTPPRLAARYLLETRSSGDGQPAHPHPFFSPDATMAFFNSDVDGQPQIWMVTGFEFP